MSRYTHVCCCVDASPANALALATAVRARGPVARLTLLHVVDRLPVARAGAPHAGTSPGDEIEASQRWLAGLAANVGAEPVVLVGGDAAGEALSWAAANDVDLLVAASYHDRLERAVLGSFARDLAHGAPCAVLIARPGPQDAAPGDVGDVDLAVACVEEGPAAVRVVAEARALGADRLALLHASPGRGLDRLAGGWEVVQDAPPAWLADLARGAGAQEVVQLRGRTGPAIIAWAEASGAGVLAVAARSHPGPVALLGSVTSHLVREAPCPVLVARPPDAPGN